MNKVIDKGFRSCRFVSTIVKYPVHVTALRAAQNALKTLKFPSDDIYFKQNTLLF